MGHGTVNRAKSKALGATGTGLALAALITLAACEREVVLDGPRFSVRTPLNQTLAEDGTIAAPPAEVLPSGTRAIALPAAAALSEWTHRAGSARHSLPHGTLSASPVRVWSAAIGAGNSKRARIASAPVALGGRIFAMDAGGDVTALAANGAVLWRASARPDFDTAADTAGGGLAAAGSSLYVTTGAGEVLALDAATGALRWRARLGSAISGPPTADAARVYAIGRNGSAAALDASNGRILWQIESAPRAGGMLGAGAAALDGAGAVYLPFSGGQIEAVGTDGATKWRAAVAGQRLGRAYAAFGDITGDPVLAGGRLFVGTAGGRMAAFDAATGEAIWSAPEGALNAPLVVGGSVFVVNDEARLVRMDAATGEVIWAQTMPYFEKDRPRRLKAITAHYGPVLAGGRLVVASGDGALRLFDPASGALLGQSEIPGGAASPPALLGGALLVMGGNGQLHAFR
jgi:outer membrane protein assembly factor BamB